MSHYRILIAIRDAAERADVIGVLSRSYELCDTGDFQEAEVMLQVCEPDMIVLEKGLGENQGVELCQTLRDDHAFNDVPIIVVGEFQSKSDFSEAYDAGANICMVSPPSPDRLLDHLRGSVVRDKARLHQKQFTIEHLRAKGISAHPRNANPKVESAEAVEPVAFTPEPQPEPAMPVLTEPAKTNEPQAEPETAPTRGKLKSIKRMLGRVAGVSVKAEPRQEEVDPMAQTIYWDSDPDDEFLPTAGPREEAEELAAVQMIAEPAVAAATEAQEIKRETEPVEPAPVEKKPEPRPRSITPSEFETPYHPGEPSRHEPRKAEVQAAPTIETVIQPIPATVSGATHLEEIGKQANPGAEIMSGERKSIISKDAPKLIVTNSLNTGGGAYTPLSSQPLHSFRMLTPMGDAGLSKQDKQSAEAPKAPEPRPQAAPPRSSWNLAPSREPVKPAASSPKPVANDQPAAAAPKPLNKPRFPEAAAQTPKGLKIIPPTAPEKKAKRPEGFKPNMKTSNAWRTTSDTPAEVPAEFTNLFK